MDDMPLVSVITACYNGERYLDTYFESIINQIYKNIQLILVNDGSTDNSLRIMNSYREDLKNRNIDYYIINKENGGALSAVAAGIKIINGDYLTWPDVDDYLHADYISSKVEFLRKNTQYNFLINPYHIYYKSNPGQILDTAWKKNFKNKEELIYRFINGIDVGYAPGAFMAKTSLLLELYPDKNIFSEMKIGQNIPLAFPMIYFGNPGFYNNCLYDYFLHEGNQHTVYAKDQYRETKVLYEKVLETLPIVDEIKEEILCQVYNRSNQLLLGVALEKRDKILAQDCIVQLRQNKGLRCKDWIKYKIVCSHFLFRIYKEIKGVGKNEFC